MRKNEKANSPSTKAQLSLIEESSGAACPITVKAYEALAGKAEGYKPFLPILEQVYARGILTADEDSKNTPEQQAFNRVNSFLNIGKACEIDSDLLENVGMVISTYQEEKAQQRSKSHGRHNPNLIDYYWASQLTESHKYQGTTSVIKKVIRESRKR